jgi:hypothetical protein
MSNTPYRYEHEAILLNLMKEKMLISSNKRDREIKIRIIIPESNSLNNPNIIAISIAAYERGFVVLYEEATSDLRENKQN